MFVLLYDIDLDSVGVAPSPVLFKFLFFNQIECCLEDGTSTLFSSAASIGL